MALRFMDGFDHYPSSSSILTKWTNFLLGSSYFDSSGQYLNAAPGLGRNSSGAVQVFGQGGSSYGRLIKALDNQATWIVGVAINMKVVPNADFPLIGFRDGNTLQCAVGVDAGGRLYWRNSAGTKVATGTTTMSATAWYYIEVKVTISSSVAASSCVASINGVPEVTLSAGASTKATSNAYANAIELTWNGINVASTAIYFDDLYVCDGTGSINNDMLGDVRVECLYPTGVGATTQWTPLSGSNYGNVNEARFDGDTSYVSSAGITSKDTYVLGDLSSTPSNIFGIQTVIVAKKDDAGGRAIASVVRSGGADYDGDTVAVGDSYTAIIGIRELDPNGSVLWTPTAINSLEAGVKLVG